MVVVHHTAVLKLTTQCTAFFHIHILHSLLLSVFYSRLQDMARSSVDQWAAKIKNDYLKYLDMCAKNILVKTESLEERMKGIFLLHVCTCHDGSKRSLRMASVKTPWKFPPPLPPSNVNLKLVHKILGSVLAQHN